MSAYSSSVSRPGRKGTAGSDPRELFMVDFGDMTLEAWEETFDFANGKTFVKQISSGKADTFPIIGRKRDGRDHIPGEVILGGGVDVVSGSAEHMAAGIDAEGGMVNKGEPGHNA